MSNVLISLVLSIPLIGAYAILSVGIVMIYRASGVLNLAHGAMIMIPPYVLYSLSQWGVPVIAGVPLAIAAGGLLGVGIERIFIRPLRGESATAQTVGTVAALGLLIAVAQKVWGSNPLPAVQVFPQGRIAVGFSSISYAGIGQFIVMIFVTSALIFLFQRTDLGLLMRGTAENRTASSLMGVNPERITAMSWAMGGALAGLTGIMLGSNFTTLDQVTLALQMLFGFVGALLGGLAALTSALWGAAIVGATQALVPALGPLQAVQGAPQLFLAILAIVAIAVRGRTLVAGGTRGAGLAAGSKPGRLTGSSTDLARRARPLRQRPAVLAGIVLALIFPWIPGLPFAILSNANRASVFALAAVSLVVLTGWVGQISLAHAAFLGIGAYMTGLLAAGLGLPFPANIPIAGLVAAGVAAVLGFVAVRVRGLYLAVATLIFSWMASEYLFRQEWFIRHSQIQPRPIGVADTFPYFDFLDERIFFVVAWAVVAFAILSLSNLRQSKSGRAFFAVQGSETAAASLGIDVVRYKLLAFSLSGFFAGVAGNLSMSNLRTVTPEQFDFTDSFFLLSVAVVGGLRSMGGAVAAGLLFAALEVVFFRIEALGGLLDLVSTALLAFVLLVYREGLAAVPQSLSALAKRMRDARETVRHSAHAARDRVVTAGPLAAVRSWTRRLPVVSRGGGTSWSALVEEAAGQVSPGGNGAGPAPAEPDDADERPTVTVDAIVAAAEELRPQDTRGPEGPREALPAVIDAESITVRFGGLVAVSDATLSVREGEIVGLIGPNGAGKTTLFNSISGLNRPTEGRVVLHGRNVTDLPVHERAKLGIARTFQQIQLFGQLTVLDNVVVASHVHNDTGFLAHLFATPRSVTLELSGRRRAAEILDGLGLGEVADARVADLPFGILRMVEVARAMSTGFPVIMLDEPASGLDHRETDVLAALLLKIRAEGRTLLLIEHDVQMVTSVSDYMYVLDRGQMIAEGVPDVIKRNPAVIAAYLGSDTAETEPAAV